MYRRKAKKIFTFLRLLVSVRPSIVFIKIFFSIFFHNSFFFFNLFLFVIRSECCAPGGEEGRSACTLCTVTLHTHTQNHEGKKTLSLFPPSPFTPPPSAPARALPPVDLSPLSPLWWRRQQQVSSPTKEKKKRWWLCTRTYM